MAASLLATAGTANAQAIYTDIDPDVTVDQSGFGYFIDFNNDNMDDFVIGLLKTNTAGGNSYNKVVAIPYNGSIAGKHQGNYVYPFAFGEGEMVDANLMWQNATSQTMGAGIVIPGSSSLYSVFGYWYGVTDKYLPMRFKVGTDKHYAWARLDVPTLLTSFTIKDYAYNSIPNEGLFTGQGDPTGVVTPIKEPVKIFAYDGILHAILFNQKIENASLAVINLMGQQVKSIRLTEASTQLDVSDLAYGIYAVTVENGGRTYTEKIAIRK